jgi:hypothetical protein
MTILLLRSLNEESIEFLIANVLFVLIICLQKVNLHFLSRCLIVNFLDKASFYPSRKNRHEEDLFIKNMENLSELKVDLSFIGYRRSLR